MKNLFLLTPLLVIVACGGKDYEETEYDIKISEFLEDKDWETDRQENGLYIYIEEEGSIEKPFPSDYLTLIYEGRLLDGTVFDGTNGQAVTFPFPMDNLIPGWQEGIPSFGRGGKGKLIIPPDLGYGDQETGPIPAKSILVFDIEIVDFTSKPPAPPAQIDYSAEIDEYINANELGELLKTESGLYIRIDEAGSDEKPGLDDYLTLNYNGYLLDGSEFDGTGGIPTTFPFPVSNLIRGWQEGLPYFGKGGKGKLIIPPYLGYGEGGSETIPPNSILVFDIEIIDFTSTTPEL